MMRKTAPVFLMVLLIAACGGGGPSAPEVSRAHTPYPSGMSYDEFRSHAFNDGTDMNAVQKRFLLLDRDNNGVLSPSEFSGY